MLWLYHNTGKEYYRMDEKNMEMKQLLLEMLAWFHEYCRSHDLRYYVVGGTFLGAVRHQGFIPWDDDVDVGMPREDYDRFAELMAAEPNPRYRYETPENCGWDFFYPYSKIYDTATTLTENTRYKIKRGLFLDVFPLDGVGDTEEDARKRIAAVERKRSVLLTLTTGIRKGRKSYKNLAVLAMRIVPDWLISKKKLLAEVHRPDCVSSFEQSYWAGNLMGKLNGSEIMPRKYYGIPREYPFENITVYGPENAEAYLTAIYGDWRKLPPEEKRNAVHDILYCDYHKGYLD